MKKGWKVFWIICGVTLTVGGALCAAGLVLGASLRGMVDIYKHSLSVNEQIFRFWEKQTEMILGDDFDSEIDADDMFENINPGMNKNDAYSFTGVESLDVELGNASLTIRIHDDQEILIDSSELKNPKRLSCRQDNSELEIELENNASFSEKGSLVVYVPKDLIFREVNFDIGGGALEVDHIQAQRMELSVGAGAAKVKMCQVDELDAECGAGLLELTMSGQQSSYDYSLECGVGDVTLGSETYSGLAYEKEIHNGQNRWINIECGLGAVKLEFAGIE